MDVLIYRETQFRKRLRQLYKAGGKKSQVAERVDTIIERLCRRSSNPEVHGKLTQYGEARVEKCRKLNLGSGYRLLYSVDRSRFLFLFVGTHDECDRWLTHNTGFEVLDEGNLSKVAPHPEEDPEPSAESHSTEEEMDYEGMLMKKLDDRTLRRIFCGLSGEKVLQ
jgi:mRNA-degrading endonuclease RelE of RelBE toxin-antitoxin system